MEIKYTLAPEDLVAAQRFHAQEQGKIIQPVGWACLLVLLLAAGWHPISDAIRGEAVTVSGWWPVLMFGGLAGVFLCHRLTRDRRIEAAVHRQWVAINQEQQFVEERLALSAEGVACSTTQGSELLPWHSIAKIRAGSDHGFLYLSGDTIQVIPKRCFPSEAAFQTFMDAARRYHATAIGS
jgi:hypothetical protein